MLDPALAWQALRSAEKLHSASVVQDALLRVSSDITRVLSTDNPLVLCVMGGAVVFSGQLLPLLNFPLSFDYLHVTRYGDAIEGGSIEWKVFPQTAIARRVVLVVDDILDAGQTMAEIRTRVMACGAERFFCAVFVDKNTGKKKPLTADFVGLTVPDRFVFGYGMDIHGAWRNLPEIYARKE